MSKLVSVIIPVYNAEKYLPDCIEGLLSQRYQPFELIFVDDGSTDSSPALLERYAAGHSCIRVIRQENQGVSGARNTALEAARGEYIAFCDSDDVVHADWLTGLVSALESTQAQMSCCGYAPFGNGTAPEYTLSDAPPQILTGLAEMYRGVICEDNVRGYLFNKLCLREMIDMEPALRFRTDLFVLEDQIFIMEYEKRISSCCCLESRLYGYRNTPGSALNQKLNDRQITALLGRRVICRLTQDTGDPMLEQAVANQLAKALVHCFKDAVLSSSPSKFRWIRHVLEVYREEYAAVRSQNGLSFKERILLLLLETTAFFLR